MLESQLLVALGNTKPSVLFRELVENNSCHVEGVFAAIASGKSQGGRYRKRLAIHLGQHSLAQLANRNRILEVVAESNSHGKSFVKMEFQYYDESEASYTQTET